MALVFLSAVSGGPVSGWRDALINALLLGLIGVLSVLIAGGVAQLHTAPLDLLYMAVLAGLLEALIYLATWRGLRPRPPPEP